MTNKTKIAVVGSGYVGMSLPEPRAQELNLSLDRGLRISRYYKYSLFLASFLLYSCGGQGVGENQNILTVEQYFDLNISIAKWQDDKISAISFDWDDSNIDHCLSIGPIFNDFDFKTTFGVVTNSLKNDEIRACYKSLALDGHEIASHSRDHVIRFNDINATYEDRVYQLEGSSNDIKNVFNLKPTLFIHPGNGIDSTNILYINYYLFSRVHNYYDNEENFIANITSETNYDRFFYILTLNKAARNWVKIAGHSVDNSGYEPIRSEDLIQFLSYLKEEEENVWVDTHSKIALYQMMRNSISVTTQNNIINFDTSSIDFEELKSFGIEHIPITILINSVDPIQIDGYLSCDDIPYGGQDLRFNYNIMLDKNLSYKKC